MSTFRIDYGKGEHRESGLCTATRFEVVDDESDGGVQARFYDHGGTLVGVFVDVNSVVLVSDMTTILAPGLKPNAKRSKFLPFSRRRKTS